MEQYKCPFQVGDSVIPMTPLDPSEGPGWSGGQNWHHKQRTHVVLER